MGDTHQKIVINPKIYQIMKQIQVIGNIGREPEVKRTSDGKEIVTFSVAVSAGENATLWFNVVARNVAKVMQYLTKGRQIFVQGDLTLKLYNGQIDCTIFADKVQLCGNKTEPTPTPATQPEETVQPVETPPDTF